MAGLRNPFGIAPDVDQEQALRELYPTAQAGPVTNDAIDRATAGEFQRGLRSGYFGAIQAAPRALIGAAQDAFGYRNAAQQSYENVNALLRRAGDSAPTTKWADVNGPGSLGRYAAGAVGNAMATTLPGVAVGLATRSPARGLMTMFPMEAGETAAEVAQMPAAQRPDPGATLRASLAKGAVNTAIEAAPFMHMFGQGPLRALTSGVTNPVARFGGRAATQMGAEGGTEYLQQGVGQLAQSHLQPGRDTSGDAEDRAEAFRQGFFGATPFGGMAGVSGAMKDASEFGRNKLDKASDFIERSKGKPAAEILKDIAGEGREQRYSMYINGNPTAEEDVVKHGEKSLLVQQLKDKKLDPRELGAEIDAFMRGEKGYDDTKKAAVFMDFLDRSFGGRQYVEPLLDKYEKGINDTGTLVTKPEEVRAEMNKPPAWLDSDGVTSFSEADLELSGDDYKQYVAEEHGLQSLFDGDSDYIYDGALTSRRPFANKAASRAAVERAKRMNPHVTNAEYIPVLQQVYESGLDPEQVRRELIKATKETLQNDVNEGNKAAAKGDTARVESARKRIRDGNDILKKLGNETVDPDTGEIKLDRSIVDALSDVYVVRTNGSGDNQNFSPKDIKEMKPGSDDVASTLQFAAGSGKAVNVNVREMMRKHMKRADKLDDNGSLVPPRVWMYRALMSGLAGLQNSGLQLKSELNDDLLVYADRRGENRITLGDLKKAEQAMATRDRRVTNEGIESPEEQAAREYRSDAARNAYSDTTGFTATGEGPEGAAGESFDPTANTLREQQPGGPPRYTDKGEEIWGQEQEANIRRFEEGLVGDPTKVGAQWGNHLNPAPDQVTAAPGKLINESMEPRGFNTPAGADQPTALPAQKPTKLTPEDVKPENERVTTYSVKDIDAQIDEVMRAIMANGNKAEPNPDVDQQLFASLQALRAQRVAAVREERAAVAESKKGGGGVKLAEQPQQKVTDPFAYPEGPNRPWQAGISEAEAPKVERTEPDVPPLAGGPPAADISVPVEQRQHEARMKDDVKPLSTERKNVLARARRQVKKAAANAPKVEETHGLPPPTDEPPMMTSEEYAQFANREDVELVEPDVENVKQAESGRVVLPNTSPYTAKDQAKSDKATKFIGRGSPSSSTAAYAKAWGDRANTGVYTKDDRVFVSAEGNRTGRLAPDFAELLKAVEAGATIITDVEADRKRPYNVGERAVAAALTADGYVESKPGEWTPKVEAPKTEAAPDLLSRIQDSRKLDSAAFKALVEETRGVLKEGKLPAEERKVLAKALGEAGVARSRGAQALDDMLADDKPVNSLFRKQTDKLFNMALNASTEQLEKEIAASVREITKLGVKLGEVGDNSLRGFTTQTQFIAYMFDRLGRFADIPKNVRAEKWLRENLNEPMDVVDLIEKLQPLVDDKFTATLLKALHKLGLNITVSKAVLENQLGVYRPSENAVVLQTDKPMLSTLLHELTHVATTAALTRQPAAFEALHSLLEHMRATNPAFDEAYGGTNVFEFLAEGMSNPNLRRMMQRTPASAEVRSLLGKVKNAWDAFVRIVRTTLGMSESEENALSQFLDVAGVLMKYTGQHNPSPENWARNTMLMTSPTFRRQFNELSGKLSPEIRAGIQMALRGEQPGKADVLAVDSIVRWGVSWGGKSDIEIAESYIDYRDEVLSDAFSGTNSASFLPSLLDFAFDHGGEISEQMDQARGAISDALDPYLSYPDIRSKDYEEMLKNYERLRDEAEKVDRKRLQQISAAFGVFKDKFSGEVQQSDDRVDVSKALRLVEKLDPSLELHKRVIDAVREIRNPLVDRSGLEAIASKNRNDGGNAREVEAPFSRAVDDTQSMLTEQGREDIRKLILKQRGDQVKVAFETSFELGPKGIDEYGHETSEGRAAGRFTRKKGERTIEIAMDVAYATAESAAYHESMHDFLASLRGLGSTPQMRAAAATIENMHKNVEVMMQLKELLKDHPEAWKAAQGDANEAAAYIYQFWVKGLIKVAPAPRNLFEKIAKFFRDTLNILSQDEKARILMDALAKGDFAKMSVAAEVINSRKLETFVDKTKRIAGPLMNVSSVLVTSSTDRLREMNIPAFREIADLFHKEADQERGELGYLQRNGQMSAQWKARLNRVLSGHSNEELKEALRVLQSSENSTLPLVTDIRRILDDMYDYMRKAGVKEAVRSVEKVYDEDLKQEVEKEVTRWTDIRKISDKYFPRFWDPNAILRDQPKFVALLMKHGNLSELEATSVVKAITSSPQDEIVDETTYTPYMMSASNRRLHFINKMNAGEFAEFQKQDLVEVMTNYVSHSVRRAESSRSFGHAYERVDQLIEQGREEGATEDDIKVAKKAVAAMTGSLRHDMDRGVRQFMTNMIAYENVVLLPFALLNNLTDVVHVAIRSGDLSEGWKAFNTGLKEMKRTIMRQGPSEEKRFAEMVGTIDETVALGAYGEAYEGVYMTGFARKLNDAFFKYNGMQTWNHAMRTAATQAGLRFIVRHGTGEKTEHSDRYLYELGLERDLVEKLVDDKGNLAVFTPDIAKALGKPVESDEVQEAAAKIQQAVYRFADDAALRPNAAHRPIWGSDPYYMLLFHLKQFTYTFQAVTAKFMNKELAYGSVMPVATLMVYAPFALAIQTVRSLMLGKPVDTSFGGVLMSLAKSGTMLGTGTFGIDALKDTAMGRVPGASLIGPAPAHGLLAIQTLLGADGTTLARLAERSVPLSPVVKAAT